MPADALATATRLVDAQRTAEEFFDAIAARKILRPGVLESEASATIHALAAELYGKPTWWHRRIVRAGRNTLCPYTEHPPDLTLAQQDICFVDLGPVFEGWEADYGRTWVLGDDPVRRRLRDDVEEVFEEGRRWFEAHPDCTGAALYAEMVARARAHGWEFGGPHCGHLVGEFPHDHIPGDKVLGYIHPDNPTPLRGTLPDGRTRFWILESHLVDRERGFGAFFEALLNTREVLQGRQG